MSSLPQVLQTPGVNDIYEYNELHLDSAARDSGTNDEPVFIINPAFSDVLGVKLLSAQIPFTYYVFNEDNTAFEVLPNANPDEAVGVFLPPGNYTVNTIVTPLVQTLKNATGDNYTCTYSGSSGRFTITSTTSTPFALKFGETNDKGSTNPRLWLGFGPGINASDAFGTLVSPFIANITGPNYLYIVSSFGGRLGQYIRVNGDSTAEAPAFAKIPVNVNPYGVIDHADHNSEYFFDMGLGQIQQVKLGLIFGHTLDKINMNGAPWSVVIQVLTQRKNTVSRRVQDLGEAVSSGKKRIRVL